MKVGPLADGPYVEVRRGPYLESIHSIAACVVRADGEILEAIGDVDAIYPVRSLAKPFIAEQFVRCGAADAFGFSEAEIALASGSHDGQEQHIKTVRGMLERIGLDEYALLCGPAREGGLVAGPPVANNCSGKHAAVLAMCKHLSFPIEHYIDHQHPIERFLVPELMRKFGAEESLTPLAVDGCGMPIFGSSLRRIAMAYAGFGAAENAAALRVREAMGSDPEYVGGWNSNLDTRVIAWSGGAIIGKIGAEGLHADTLVGSGIGIAVKVLDGNSRALPPVLARLFVEFFGEEVIPQQWIGELAIPPVLNAAGRRVGDIRSRWNTDVDQARVQ
jgi:L-asparaginase II